ncbi:MAG: hypothetical protein AAFQ82_19290 [Myxococcota bacterium]
MSIHLRGPQNTAPNPLEQQSAAAPAGSRPRMAGATAAGDEVTQHLAGFLGRMPENSGPTYEQFLTQQRSALTSANIQSAVSDVVSSMIANLGREKA